jgi:hypothetical protein
MYAGINTHGNKSDKIKWKQIKILGSMTGWLRNDRPREIWVWPVVYRQSFETCISWVPVHSVKCDALLSTCTTHTLYYVTSYSDVKLLRHTHIHPHTHYKYVACVNSVIQRHDWVSRAVDSYSEGPWFISMSRNRIFHLEMSSNFSLLL